MKKLFTLILFIAWAFNANGQIVRDSTYLADSVARAEAILNVLNCQGCIIAIEGTDALGNKDTLYLGADSTATVGIDVPFGEVDITGRPLKPMDMRFFQRPEVCFGTASVGVPNPDRNPTFLRYRQSLELKTDFRRTWNRPRTDSIFSASSAIYVFKATTNNYPISFRMIIQVLPNNPYRDYFNIRIRGFRNCQNIGPGTDITQVDIRDTINYNNQCDHYTIYANIGIINSTKKKIKMELGVYPIPATNKIQITGLSSATNISITSLTGKEIKNVLVNPESPEVNIEGLEKGIYILYCQSKEGVQALRILKQ